jgi:hypothetical protein
MSILLLLLIIILWMLWPTSSRWARLVWACRHLRSTITRFFVPTIPPLISSQSSLITP